jgi:hypothetical protein
LETGLMGIPPCCVMIPTRSAVVLVFASLHTL